MRLCQACGETSQEHARFCAACGTRLDPLPPSGVARRTVTVLFCDVVGSTALGERADAETVRIVLNRVFDMARAVVDRNGGVVEKFIGDAVMAVFGLPVTHEDDALRAVRAADQILSGLAGLNEELRQQWAVEIRVRAGVNTGEVATGDPNVDEIFATGDAVNVAARFEQTAEPMTIVIGERTRELTSGWVEVEPLEPLTLKGKAHPVAAYRVTGLTTVGVERRSSPLQGRSAELGLLEAAFNGRAGSGGCRFTSVLGEAGIGKSRLVSEFVAQLPPDALVLRGACLPYGESDAYRPVAQAVRAYVDSRAAAGTSAMDALTDLLEGTAEAQGVGAAIADLCGLRSSAQPDEQLRWGVRRFFEVLSAKRPLVVVVEDLHWAQVPLLDMLAGLTRVSRSCHLLVVGTARPRFAEEHPAWPNDEAMVVTLGPLDRTATETLAAALIGDGPVSDPLAAHIADVTNANPLFVEEVVAQLVRDDSLRRGAQGWELRSDPAMRLLPATIQSVLGAKIDALEPDARDALERASIVGRIFYEDALEALLPAERSARTSSLIEGLVRSGLVRPAETDLPGENAYQFHHVLLRDVAELRLRKSDAAYLHERFAGWLETRQGEARELADIIGYHLEQSYQQLSALGLIDQRAEDIGKRGARALASAGRRAWDRGQDAAAIRLYERAAALLPPDSVTRARLLANAAKAQAQRDSARATRLATEIARVGEVTDDISMRVLGEVLARDAEAVGRPSGGSAVAALEIAEAATATLETSGDIESAVWACLVASSTAENLGYVSGGIEWGERALELARRADLTRESGMAIMFALGHFVSERHPVPDRISRAERALAEGARDKVSEAHILASLGVSLARAGEFEESERLFARARTITDELGSDALEPTVLQAHAGARIYARDWEAARRLNERMVESVRDCPAFMSNPVAELSLIALETGRWDEALAKARLARSLTEPEDVYPCTRATCVEAVIAGHRGEAEAALALLDEATARLAALDMPELGADVQSAKGRVLLATDRFGEASACLKSAQNAFSRLGVRAAADSIRVLAERAAQSARF